MLTKGNIKCIILIANNLYIFLYKLHTICDRLYEDRKAAINPEMGLKEM